ncbi:Pre-rRNA-processing protein PNO1 [Ramicandelaber brevisporus]|nr:Pre-rRNA-processing protein PNO1 [Ramicandelaber brevisporus]
MTSAEAAVNKKNAVNSSSSQYDEDDDGAVVLNPADLPAAPISDAMDTEEPVDGEDSETADGLEKPSFEALSASDLTSSKSHYRKVQIPPHRFSPLKNVWMKIYTPVVEHLKLQVRMNVRTKTVELRTSPETTDIAAIQKASDFIRAFTLGFDVDDAIALLRLDDLFIDSFEIKDVKTLRGDNLSRAIGRIAGKDGKTKFAIENTTKSRIVLADTRIHIMGSYQNIKIARDAVVALIMGSPPGKVYSNLRNIAQRMKERI